MSTLFSDRVNGLKVQLQTQLVLRVAAISPCWSLRHHQFEVFMALKSPICCCCSPIRLIKTWLKHRCAVRDEGLDTQSQPSVLFRLSITAVLRKHPRRSEVRVTHSSFLILVLISVFVTLTLNQPIISPLSSFGDIEIIFNI